MKLLLKNILALLPLGKSLQIKECSIFIDGQNIVAIDEAPLDFVPDKTINGKNRLAMPGLINCHTHSYMSLFRNMADDVSFDEWLFKRIMPHEDKLSTTDAYNGTLLACAEMIKTGTTTFVDMHMFKNICASAVDKAGMRAVLTRGLVGNGKNDEGGLKRINEAVEEINTWKTNSRLSFMLAPHAIYTTDAEYLSLVLETAKKLNVGINIHLSETKYEVSEALKKYGVSPVQYLDNLGMFEIPVTAAHCVHISKEDIALLSQKKVNVVLNPKSNMCLGNGFANVFEMKKAGINLCIGTDSAASNNSLNMFSDINFTTLLCKGLTEDSTALTAPEVMEFATKNAARALALNCGTIEVGKKADIAILDIDKPQFYPRHNLISALVYSANGSEVVTSIIDGQIVMENGKLTLIDEEEIYFNVEKYRKEMD